MDSGNVKEGLKFSIRDTLEEKGRYLDKEVWVLKKRSEWKILILKINNLLQKIDDIASERVQVRREKGSRGVRKGRKREQKKHHTEP